MAGVETRVVVQGVKLVTTDAEVERLVGEVAAAATALRFEAW